MGMHQEIIYVYDGHGSVRELADSSGNIIGSYDYDAYGEILSESGPMSSDNDFRYSGEQFDSDIDQYYLRARYYNQNVGRFSSMDTWGGKASRPLSLNKYNYTEGNPVMGVDPSGKFMLMEVMTMIAVGEIMAQTAIPMPSECKDCPQFADVKRYLESSPFNLGRDIVKVFKNSKEAAEQAAKEGDKLKDSHWYEYGSEIMWFKSKVGTDCYFNVFPHVGYSDLSTFEGFAPSFNKVYIMKTLKAKLDNGEMATISGYWHSHTISSKNPGFSDDDQTTLNEIRTSAPSKCMYVTLPNGEMKTHCE